MIEWISGNIFIRPNELPKKGDTIEGHKHDFDHTTIVYTGAVHVLAKYPDGSTREGDFAAPAHFLVRKGIEHTITATEPNTVFWCVYSHRTPQGEVSHENTGWQGGYQ